MQRFFVTFPLAIDISLTDSTIVSQMKRVLRVKIGENVVLFNGDGSETEYEIQKIEKKQILLRGVGRREPRTEPTKMMTLYQGMPNKYEKIEYIIQKGVEIGIRKFVFFRSDRSQKLVITRAKEERFSIIAREALEQCGGLVMPEIVFQDALPDVSVLVASEQVILDTVGLSRRMNELSSLQHIGIWVGPEGGWSEREREEMRGYGFIFARFGERVMRTETAGVSMAFAFLYA